jgi:molecular chaperone DnaK (HSP70)
VPHYGKAIVDTLPIEVVMTCPAVWSDKAKELTFEAANAAGFANYRISMLTEPEAAAIHTVQEFKDGLAGGTLNVCYSKSLLVRFY